MTKTHHAAPGEPDPTLAERLAPMTIAEIDAMSDQKIAAHGRVGRGDRR